MKRVEPPQREHPESAWWLGRAALGIAEPLAIHADLDGVLAPPVEAARARPLAPATSIHRDRVLAPRCLEATT